MRRPFPLFIIDSSRSHGRSRETDYISCTSAECPFVAEVVYLDARELSVDQDWTTRNPLCLYSEPVNGIRIKLKPVQYPGTAKTAQIKSLLKRALKEYQKRRAAVRVDPGDITNSNVVWFIDQLLQQTYENLRENPGDAQAKTVKAILTKIRNDYDETTD